MASYQLSSVDDISPAHIYVFILIQTGAALHHSQLTCHLFEALAVCFTLLPLFSCSQCGAVPVSVIVKLSIILLVFTAEMCSQSVAGTIIQVMNIDHMVWSAELVFGVFRKHENVKKYQYSVEFALLLLYYELFPWTYQCKFQISVLLLHGEKTLVDHWKRTFCYCVSRWLIGVQYVNAPSVTQVVHMPWAILKAGRVSVHV